MLHGAIQKIKVARFFMDHDVYSVAEMAPLIEIEPRNSLV